MTTNSIAGAILIIGSLYLGLRFGFVWWNYVLILIGIFQTFFNNDG